MQLCNGVTLSTPLSTGFSGTLFSNQLRMSSMIPQDQKIYYLHYDDVREDVLRPPHKCFEPLQKQKQRYFGGIVSNPGVLQVSQYVSAESSSGISVVLFHTMGFSRCHNTFLSSPLL